MNSIRPSMSGIPQTSPLQNVQRAQPAAKTEEAKAPAPKQETPAAAQDENKTKTFDDTPIADVNAFPFEAEAKAADATSDIEGIFETEDTQESEDVQEADDTDEPDDVEGGDEVEEAEPKEIEVEEEDEEEEEGGPDFDEAEGGESGEGPERHIHIAPLLELVAQLREIPRFRIEETWQVYGG